MILEHPQGLREKQHQSTNVPQAVVPCFAMLQRHFVFNNILCLLARLKISLHGTNKYIQEAFRFHFPSVSFNVFSFSLNPIHLENLWSK